MGKDATDEKAHAERPFLQGDLSEREARYRAVVETVEAAIFVFQGTKTIDMNPAAERMAGRSRAELLGMDFWTVVHPADRAMVRSRGTARQTGEDVVSNYVVRVTRPDGEVRWVDYRANMVLFGGEPAVLGVAHDITEARRTAEQLRQNLEELAHVQRLGVAEALAAGLAHELQQPLAAVAAMAGAGLRRLRDGSGEPDQLIGILEETVRLSLHAGDIVHRVHDFTQKRVRQPECVAPAELVRSALEMFSGEDRDHLRWDVSGELPTVTGDLVQLRQVVVNLVQNALEAARGADGDGKIVDLDGRSVDGAVEISVSDRGPGIEPADVDSVFDAFHSTKPTGMGLGLSICRSIMEAHGGRLWFTPRSGGGTSFRLSLRADRPGAA